MGIDEYVQCPLCHSLQAWEETLLGSLGVLMHFRCRSCGGQWTEDEPEELTQEETR